MDNALGLSAALHAFERSDSLTLLFVGDLMQHKAQLDVARTPEGKYDYSECFPYVEEEIRKADIAVETWRCLWEVRIRGIRHSVLLMSGCRLCVKRVLMCFLRPITIAWTGEERGLCEPWNSCRRLG